MEKLQELLEQCLGQNFVHMIISNPRKSDAARKIDVRPYDGEVNGKPFRSAYLQSMEVVQEIDRFAARFVGDEPRE